MSEHTIALSRRTFVGGAAIITAAACMGTVSVEEALAVTSAEKQAEAAAALNSLNAMEEKLAEAESNYGAAMVELDEANARMEDAQNRIDEASEQISTLQEHLGTRARGMYRSGATTFIDLLLGAASFHEFTTSWDLLNNMNKQDSDMVEETKALRAEVEEQKSEYARQAEIAEQKTREMAAIVEESEALVAQEQALYESLSAEAAELLAQEQEAERLRQEQAAAAAAAAAAASSSGGSSGGGYKEPAYVASTGNAIVDRAQSWVGVADYVWGACSPGAFDCSGFVSYCLTGSYSRLGTTGTFMGWPKVSEPQPGDVCVNYGHCGIYIGGGQMIHAATEGVGVVVGSVQGGMIYVRR